MDDYRLSQDKFKSKNQINTTTSEINTKNLAPLNDVSREKPIEMLSVEIAFERKKSSPIPPIGEKAKETDNIKV